MCNKDQYSPHVSPTEISIFMPDIGSLIGMLGFTQPFFHLLARFCCKTKGGLQGGFYATGHLQPLVFPSKLAYKERQNLTLWS